MKKHYTKGFFKERNIGALKSAEIIVPIVLDLIHPKSVVDVGCALGEFLYIFKENGVEDILGIDGEWVDKKKILIPENQFLAHNLENPLNVSRKFDLALCLEVAEHLDEKYSGLLIENLTNLSPVVLFSAAIPYQGGTHHINEQWQDYWAKIFEERNYLAIDCIRKKIWDNKEVGVHYRQNILIFAEKNYIENNNNLLKEYEKNNCILSIVHPELYLPKAIRDNYIKKIKNVIPSFIEKFLVKVKNLYFRG